VLAILISTCVSDRREPIPRKPVNEYLTKGNWEEGLSALATHPLEGQNAFDYGLLLTLRAVELFYQDLERHGFGRVRETGGVNLGPFPWSSNRQPEPLDYNGFMGILRRLRDRIFEASSILEQGGSGESYSGESYSDESNSGEWKSEVYLAQIKFDLNGDKARTEKESLGKVFGFFTQMDQAKMQEAQQFSLAFDAADAVWLAGYTRLVEGVLDIILVYDLRPLWEDLGHILFPNTTDSRPGSQALQRRGLWVADKASGERARQAFLKVTKLSRRSWDLALAETDNEREWLVNPNQTPPFSIEVNQKRIQDWIAFMLDWEKLLEERALLPGQVLDDQYSNQGLSLKALMQNPPNFSLREDTDIFKIFEAYLRPIRPNTEIINRGNSLMDYILGKDNDPIFALYVN